MRAGECNGGDPLSISGMISGACGGLVPADATLSTTARQGCKRRRASRGNRNGNAEREWSVFVIYA